MHSLPFINSSFRHFCIESKGIIPRLVHFLRIGQLQHEAAWVLNIICSGSAEQTAEVVNCPSAMPNLVNLLESDSAKVRHEALWALGNVAGDSTAHRDILLNLDVLSKLLPLLCTEDVISSQPIWLLRTATWTLCSLCRDKPSADWNHLQPIIHALSVMVTSDDQEILKNSCWTLAYLSDADDSEEKASMILNLIHASGSFERLISLLEYKDAVVRHPALSTFGNMTIFSGEQMQQMIDCGVLKKFKKLMTDKNERIRKCVCWALSNVMTGSERYIEAVISEDLVPDLIEMTKTEKYEIAEEALWALCNATINGTDQQMFYLVQHGVIQAMFAFLEKNRTRPTMLEEALESMVKILEIGKRYILNEDVSRKMVHGFARKTKVVYVAILNLCASYVCEPGFAGLVEECGGFQFLKELASDEGTDPYLHQIVAGILCEHLWRKL